MEILISHFYSKENKGDAAILSVLLGDIRRAFDNAHVTVLALDAMGIEDKIFEGASVKNSFMHYASDRYKNPFAKTIYGFFIAGSTLLWAFIYRYTGKDMPLPKNLRDIVALYQKSDLVIPVGGGYLRGKPGLLDTAVLFFMVHPLLFSEILNKPTICYTQSIGPFGNRFQEYMARFALKRVSGIIVREKITLALLKKWGITQNVLASVDSGFSFTSSASIDIRLELGIPKGQMLVGITVRNWLETQVQERYERTIAQFVEHVIQRYQAAVVFIPQVTVNNHRDDDREENKKVYDLISNKENIYIINERYDLSIIKALYGNLDYLVGTRFHSVIFSLTAYVPAIAVGYEHKTYGIMTDLGLEPWVADIRNVQIDPLIRLFDELVAGRPAYIDHLKKVLPPYIEQANKSIYFVKNLYEKEEIAQK